MNRIAEEQLRQLHEWWPDFKWTLKRDRLGYVMIRQCAGPERAFRAQTADEAVVRAHIRTMIEKPIRAAAVEGGRTLTVVSGGFDDAA